MGKSTLLYSSREFCCGGARRMHKDRIVGGDRCGRFPIISMAIILNSPDLYYPLKLTSK